MMMVSARRKERRGIAQPLDNVETQHPMIEIDGALQVGDFQMHVSDADTRVYRHVFKLALWGQFRRRDRTRGVKPANKKLRG
jgi:hypothetical protein